MIVLVNALIKILLTSNIFKVRFIPSMVVLVVVFNVYSIFSGFLLIKLVVFFYMPITFWPLNSILICTFGAQKLSNIALASHDRN